MLNVTGNYSTHLYLLVSGNDYAPPLAHLILQANYLTKVFCAKRSLVHIQHYSMYINIASMYMCIYLYMYTIYIYV